jgi:hypothetical protein
MDVKHLALVAVAASVCFAVPRSRADDTVEYAHIGSWTIGIDPTLGNGCFALGQWKGGTVLRLGFDLSDGGSLYFIFGNPEWQSVEYGKSYRVSISFGDETPWDGKATGISFDPPENQPFLSLGIADDQAPVFIREFMEENTIVATYEDREVFRLRLQDAERTGNKLLECQNSIDNPSPDDDPFRARPTSRRSDPFKGA